MTAHRISHGVQPALHAGVERYMATVKRDKLLGNYPVEGTAISLTDCRRAELGGILWGYQPLSNLA